MANMDHSKDVNVKQARGTKNAGNFKNDPQRAKEAGRKGGESSGKKQW